MIVPHWTEVEEFDERYKTHKLYEPNSKVYGSIEDEYKGNGNNLNIFLQKKTYLSCNTIKYDELKNKDYATEREKKISIKKAVNFHFKGIGANDMVVSSDKKTLNNNELHHLYNSPDIKRIKDSYVEFFEDLYKNKTTNILTCSLQRVSGNPKKDTDINQSERFNEKCYNIVTAYRIKKITIK